MSVYFNSPLPVSLQTSNKTDLKSLASTENRVNEVAASVLKARSDSEVPPIATAVVIPIENEENPYSASSSYRGSPPPSLASGQGSPRPSLASGQASAHVSRTPSGVFPPQAAMVNPAALENKD